MRVHYWHMCADFTLSSRDQEEKSYSWSESEMKQIANRSLVSFFCKLLPNLLAETLQILCHHYSGRFPRIFQNFSWCQLSAKQKFSRENFCGLLKICESFLTVKLLSFTVAVRQNNNEILFNSLKKMVRKYLFDQTERKNGLLQFHCSYFTTPTPIDLFDH